MRAKQAGLWAGLLLFWGCASAPRSSALRQRVAVLPLANDSVNVLAPDKIRPPLMAALAERGFVLVSTTAVDLPLRDLGFTDGGQLQALKFDELKKAVPADWYVYGVVKAYSFKSAVALSQREVELGLKVVTSTGGVVFDRVEKGITSKAGADAAGDLALNLGGKLLKGVKDVAKRALPGDKLKSAADATDQVADVDLTQETREALRKLMNGLAPEE